MKVASSLLTQTAIVLTYSSSTTIRINDTFHSRALHPWITSMLWQAGTQWPMIHWLTLSFCSTGCRTGARIQALVVDTCFSKRTFSISPTSSNTLSIFTDEPSWATLITGTEHTTSSFYAFFIVQTFVITTTSNSTDGIFAISA